MLDISFHQSICVQPEHQHVTKKEGFLCSSSGVVTVPDVGSLLLPKKLSLERITCLMSIDVVRNIYQDKTGEWDEIFEQLCAYKQEDGNCQGGAGSK
eukprot:8287415-Ditylum_brightwellii.AAC.1